MVYEMNLDLDNIIAVSPSNKLSLSDLKLNQLYRVVADPNSIDDTGKEKITEMLSKVNLRAPEWDSLLPEGFDPYDYNNGNKNRLIKLPADWSWKNTVTDKKGADGKYGTGKFAKRVRAYILKEQGFPLPEKFIQDLGQIAGRYSDQSTGTVLRFVDTFDWNAGDFGDPHSCFWGGREEARVMLKDHGAWAVQLFTTDSIDAGTPAGYARMWIVRNFPISGVWTMFNGYGYNMGDPSMTIARLMVNLIGETQFREIKLRNHKTTDGTLYINSGNGYVIGEPATPLKEKYDFDWPEKILGSCCHCDDDIYEDDDHESIDDRLYCESCWSNHVHYDNIADEHFDPDYEDAVYMMRRTHNGRFFEEYVMLSTADRYGEVCDHCDKCYEAEYMMYVETANLNLCSECYSENVVCCDNCGTDHVTEDMEEIDDDMLCPVCAQDAKDEQEAEEERARQQEIDDAQMELQADE